MNVARTACARCREHDSWRRAGGPTRRRAALRADGAELAPPASRRARAVLAYLALHPGPHAARPARRALLARRARRVRPHQPARRADRAAPRARPGGRATSSPRARRSRSTAPASPSTRARSRRRSTPATRPRALAACRAPILDGFDDDWAHEARQAHAAAARRGARAARGRAPPTPPRRSRLTREQVALDPLAEEPNRRLIERLARPATAPPRSPRASASPSGCAARSASRRRARRARCSTSCGARRRAGRAAARARARARHRVRRPRAPSSSALRASWAGVQMHRDRRLVLLAGEPGVGKTRLAHEFARGGARRRRDRAARPLLGGAAGPVRAVRRGAAPGRRGRRAAAGRPPTTRARATACSTPSTPRSPTSPRAPAAARHRRPPLGRPRHAAARELPAALGAAPGRCSSLGTYRDTELGRRSPLTGALADLQRDGALDRIGLRGLDDGRRRRARRARCSATTRSPPRVHARTGGNAFFVEEVLRGLAEAATPGCRRACATPSASGSRGSATPPTSCSPPRRSSASSSTRARCRRPPGSSPTPPRPRSTRSCARACCARAAAGAASSSRTRSCARRCYDELNVLRRARLHRRAADALTALGEDRHLEEIAAAPVRGGVDRRRPARRRDARPRRPPRARPARLRGRRRALRARARGARARRRRGRGRPGAARARRRAAARRRARRGARGVHRGRARSRAARGDAALLGEAALGFAGLGIAIVDLDAEAIARLEEALEHAADRVAALAPAGAPRGRALLRARPHALGGAQRRGGRDRPRAPATRARSPPRSTRATSRCGAPTASRSGSPRPPT